MWTYDWDYERRLKAFKKNSATLVEYAHNPTGTRRYSSDSTLGLTNYFYSGNQVLGDYSSNWSLSKSYILGPSIDEIIAMIDRTTEPNTSYYFTRDRLGSTRELVNTEETINARYAYDVWGDPTETQLSGSISTRKQFTGRPYSGTSALHNYRARYYANSVGRFVSRDPLYDMALTHVRNYAYVDNNPATMVDPTGLVPGLMDPAWGMSWAACVAQCNWLQVQCERDVDRLQTFYKGVSLTMTLFNPPTTITAFAVSYLTGVGMDTIFDYGRKMCAHRGDQCRRGCGDKPEAEQCPIDLRTGLPDELCCDKSNYTKNQCCRSGAACVACEAACGRDQFPCAYTWDQRRIRNVWDWGCHYWRLYCTVGWESSRNGPYYTGRYYYWVGPVVTSYYFSAKGECGK